MKVRALLFDTRSIQSYIYSGNLLKTNIGASYLVGRLFEDVLVKKVLKADGNNSVNKKLFSSDTMVDSESWKKEKTLSLSRFEQGCLCRVALIGGGNALLLVSPEAEAGIEQKIVERFTKVLLYECPGLRTGAASGYLDTDDFKGSYQKLRQILRHNQDLVVPQVNVPYTGLTLNCKINGEVANFCDVKGEMSSAETKDKDWRNTDPGGISGRELRFYSQETWAKTRAADDADKWLHNGIAEGLKNIGKENLLQGYKFPSEISRLGQYENENYIAVVHIDGNNMGKMFADQESLTKLRNKSEEVKKKTWNSLIKLISYIITTIKEKPEWYDGYLQLKKDNRGRIFLPIRPLIIGGDDITFVCAAKVALLFTKKIMSFMMEPENEANDVPRQGQTKKKKKEKNAAAQKQDGSIDCCGGIAILKTNYPFFRGYKLAEQACSAAKAKSRTFPGSSWLEFVLLHGQQAPTLTQIREQEYRGEVGELHFGPYLVSNNDKDLQKERDLRNLLTFIKKMHYSTDKDNPNMPMNKVKEMRAVLQHSEHDVKEFMEQLYKQMKGRYQALGSEPSLPFKIKAWEKYEQDLWGIDNERKTMVTPYVDAIEMMDFYKPEVEL